MRILPTRLIPPVTTIHTDAVLFITAADFMHTIHNGADRNQVCTREPWSYCRYLKFVHLQAILTGSPQAPGPSLDFSQTAMSTPPLSVTNNSLLAHKTRLERSISSTETHIRLLNNVLDDLVRELDEVKQALHAHGICDFSAGTFDWSCRLNAGLSQVFGLSQFRNGQERYEEFLFTEIVKFA